MDQKSNAQQEYIYVNFPLFWNFKVSLLENVY